MTAEQAKQIVTALTAKGIEFDSGLADDEVAEVEAAFCFRFPPDLKLFLRTALPASGGFVHWRLGLRSKKTRQHLIARLEQPFDGILFDIKHNGFWVDTWGIKPASYQDQALVARQHFVTYPKLIPVYSHRYIPDTPHEAGNPIYSVYQTDIIYYGYDLASYLAKEFRIDLPRGMKVANQPKLTIDFWSNLAG